MAQALQTVSEVILDSSVGNYPDARFKVTQAKIELSKLIQHLPKEIGDDIEGLLTALFEVQIPYIQAMSLLSARDYEESSKKFDELASNFQKMLEDARSLGEVPEEVSSFYEGFEHFCHGLSRFAEAEGLSSRNESAKAALVIRDSSSLFDQASEALAKADNSRLPLSTEFVKMCNAYSSVHIPSSIHHFELKAQLEEEVKNLREKNSNLQVNIQNTNQQNNEIIQNIENNVKVGIRNILDQINQTPPEADSKTEDEKKDIITEGENLLADQVPTFLTKAPAWLKTVQQYIQKGGQKLSPLAPYIGPLASLAGTALKYAH